MIYHAFFDTTSLSDQEIFQKLVQLRQRLDHSHNHGQTQMASELQLMIDSLVEEQSNRYAMRAYEQEQKDIEKDGSLANRYGNKSIDIGSVEPDNE